MSYLKVQPLRDILHLYIVLPRRRVFANLYLCHRHFKKVITVNDFIKMGIAGQTSYDIFTRVELGLSMERRKVSGRRVKKMPHKKRKALVNDAH